MSQDIIKLFFLCLNKKFITCKNKKSDPRHPYEITLEQINKNN